METIQVLGRTLVLVEILANDMKVYKTVITQPGMQLEAYFNQTAINPWILHARSSEGFLGLVECRTLESAVARIREELAYEIARRQTLLSELGT